jgi:Ser-tRNA(Ala) deacylase AlaX
VNRTYLTDSYTKALSTMVISTRDLDGCTAMSVEDLIFHPEGGGQPSDSGTLFLGDSEHPVVHLQKHKGDVFIVLGQLLDDHHDIGYGTEVTCKLDWDRRYRFMRLHTAAHVVMGAARRILKGYQPMGIEIGDDGAACTVNFECEEPITQEQVDGIIGIANEVIASGFSVRAVKHANLAAAAEACGEIFRANLDLKLKGAVRTIVVESFDANPCGGTHVHSLSELSPVTTRSFADKSLLFAFDTAS